MADSSYLHITSPDRCFCLGQIKESHPSCYSSNEVLGGSKQVLQEPTGFSDEALALVLFACIAEFLLAGGAVSFGKPMNEFVECFALLRSLPNKPHIVIEISVNMTASARIIFIIEVHWSHVSGGAPVMY